MPRERCPRVSPAEPVRPLRIHSVRFLALAASLASSVTACGGARARAADAPAPLASVVANATVDDAPTVARGREGGSLSEVRFWSPSLGTTKSYDVWLPPGYARDTAARYPVAFYLHGLYGDETNWSRQGRLAATLDSMTAAGLPPMIVVMPDGDDSWYVTSNVLVTDAQCRRVERREPADRYCVPWWRYDEYIARDLVAHVDSAYRTRADRAHRAIAGLSMGGYGAVTLALRYPDVFAAAASHSGVLSPLYDGPSPFAAPPRYASTPERLEEKWAAFWPSMGVAFGRDTAAWQAREPIGLVRRARALGTTLPALWFDAGTDDALVVDENRAFDWELTAMGVAHEWHERPGKHDWTYWSTNAPRSLAWIGARIGGPAGR
jgi:S-formylglutathione hydrolase FrmB